MTDQVSSIEVNGFYGPGSIAGWLLTYVSVFVSWKFDDDFRDQDTLGNDFLMVLMIPSIAAVHFFVQMAGYPATFYEMAPGPIGIPNPRRLFPDRDHGLQVSLGVCSLAMLFNMILLRVAGSGNRRKRWLMATQYLCLTAWVFARWMHFLQRSIGKDILIMPPIVLVTFGVFVMCTNIGWEWDDDPPFAPPFGSTSIVYMCLDSLFRAMICEGPRPTETEPRYCFMPSIDISITELDQAVACSLGVMALASSIYHALRGTWLLK